MNKTEARAIINKLAALLPPGACFYIPSNPNFIQCKYATLRAFICQLIR